MQPDEIADILEVQAADAEDDSVIEGADAEPDNKADSTADSEADYVGVQEADPEADAALRVQATAERQNLAADAQAKAEPKLIQADLTNPDQAKQDLSHPLLDGQTRQEATGVTQDLHEADLDLSHTDKAPGKSSTSSAYAFCFGCHIILFFFFTAFLLSVMQ